MNLLNSFEKKKTQINEQTYFFVLIMRSNMLFSGEIYTTLAKIYTAVSSDGSDKYHLCPWV